MTPGYMSVQEAAALLERAPVTIFGTLPRVLMPGKGCVIPRDILPPRRQVSEEEG